MSRLTSFVLLVALTFFAVSVEATVYFDVYGRPYEKVTIAVPPFAGVEGQRTELSDLLGQDLDLSGFFVVAPRSLMDNGLMSEGPERSPIRFDQWRSLNVGFLSKALVRAGENNFSLEAYLYDTSDGTPLLAKKYSAAPSEWRRVIHKLADEIILTVTGEMGIMSSRILFVAGDTLHRDVYVADLDGHRMSKLTDEGQIIVSPSVSPDGKYLAFTSYKGGQPNLYVVDLATNREVYADKREGTEVGSSWMDSRTITYAHILGETSTIYSANVEAKERKVLLSRNAILVSPTFSPDGNKMLFVSDMHGGTNIFMKDMATGEITRLSYFTDYNASPAFSPKGDLVAFVSKTEGALEICVMRPDGSDALVLSHGGINDSPQFSPDGRYILYSSQKGRKSSIHLMLRNGENDRELKFTGTDVSQPKFMP